MLCLSKKLTVLLSRFYLSRLKFTDFGARFNMRHMLKQNKPGDPLCSIKVYAYQPNRKICPIVCEYIQRTSMLRRNGNQLLLSTKKPHGPTARNTVASWTKKVLRASGIDTSRFAPHSTRAASTSAAFSFGYKY